MKKYLHLLSFLIFLFFSITSTQTQAQELELDTTMWETNGNVKALVSSGNTIYIGGEFTYVGPKTGSGVILNQSDGKVTAKPSLKINGRIHTAISDGKGGWFVGGEFTQVQEVAQKYVAHILADGILDKAWNPNLDARVLILTLSGNIVYIGGDFTRIGGQSRNNLAAIDATTGQATAWNPNANNKVNAITVSGNVVYAGGHFTSIGGQARNYFAAFGRPVQQPNPTSTDSYFSSQIKLYPNPTTGKFTLVIPAGLGNQVELSIWDALSRNVLALPLSNPTSGEYRQDIDLSAQVGGLYLIKLQTTKGVLVKRVFKR